MFGRARRQELETIGGDVRLIMTFPMGLDAKVDEILQRLDFEDGEEEETENQP
jgi:hypothetical protein